MKSPGVSSPRSGCCQRTSASAPSDRPVRQRHDRLVVDGEVLVLQRPAEVREHALAPQRVLVASAASACPRPGRPWRRTSRHRRSAAAHRHRRRRRGSVAAPMLAATLKDSSSNAKGSARAGEIWPTADFERGVESRPDGSRIRCPRRRSRATNASVPIASTSRGPSSRSTRRRIGARVSLISLKRSRSMNSSATGSPCESPPGRGR